MKSYFKNYYNIFSYVKQYKFWFYSTLFILLISSLLEPFIPLIFNYIVDEYSYNTEYNHNGISAYFDYINSKFTKDFQSSLLFWFIIMVLFLIFQTILQFLSLYYSTILGQKVIHDVRTKLYKKYLTFNNKFFDKNPVGKSITRIISDTEAFKEVFSDGILPIISELGKLFVIIIIMFVINFKLSFLVLLTIPLLFWATNVFKNRLKTAYIEESSQVSRFNIFVQERLAAMKILKIFNREEVEYKEFENINNSLMKTHFKTIWAYSIFFPIVDFLLSLSTAILIFYICFYLLQIDVENTSIGVFFAFSMFLGKIFRPIRLIADKFNVIQRGITRSKNIFSILENAENIKENNASQRIDIQGKIEFQNMYFSYNNTNNVLKNFNFTIQKGQRIAIVGETGAGKSSIINVLCGFYKFQSGRLLIDDIDFTKLDYKNYLSQIAIVLQEKFLFSDTIYNNLTLYNDKIKLEDIRKIAKNIGVDEFIMKLPSNYFFVLNETASNISEGQKQLLTFLRAYLINPKILILDEATSSLDSISESLIHKVINDITKDRTSIIIAHRLSTIRNADIIIVMKDGEIIEAGTHDELLKNDNYYKKLYDIQI